MNWRQTVCASAIVAVGAGLTIMVVQIVIGEFREQDERIDELERWRTAEEIRLEVREQVRREGERWSP